MNNITATEQRIIEALKTVFDPEIPVNIYDLGLIYNIELDDFQNVKIIMTLTAPNCPMAEQIPLDVKTAILNIENINNVDVELTFSPPWNEELMSDLARLEMGFL